MTWEEDPWIQVFKRRDAWTLTADDLSNWKLRNATMFSYIRDLAPAGGYILEVGCGPGRHALSSASLGYLVHGIDRNPLIVGQAAGNAARCGLSQLATFHVADMLDRDTIPAYPYAAVTHGGLLEHLGSEGEVQGILAMQLTCAPYVIFDVPALTPKNEKLFAQDDIFRQPWSPDYWLGTVLEEFTIDRTALEEHPDRNMTDDLVVAVSR
jgi:SAM-dependent methyltransferase